jgi:hypothetical protein
VSRDTLQLGFPAFTRRFPRTRVSADVLHKNYFSTVFESVQTRFATEEHLVVSLWVDKKERKKQRARDASQW